MRILLIRAVPNYVKEKSTMPLGLLSIATHLAQNGHTVKIADRMAEKENLGKLLKRFMPDMVGLSVISQKSFEDAVKVSKTVKKKNIPVVWGGLTTSFLPELIMKTGAVNFVVMGEGEITLLALVNAIAARTPLRDVDGIAYFENSKIIVNKPREPADLSMLPVIDFSFIDPAKYFLTNISGKERILHTYSSKGCLFQCTYCYNPSFSKGVWRGRPPAYFLSEIKYLIENCHCDAIYFIDDLFSKNKEHLFEVCEQISASGLEFVWGCDMRADMCDEEDIKKMYDSGCRWIFFGIETGSVRMQKAIRKNLNLEKAKKTLSYCSETGIVATASFMIGFPDETEDDIRQTVSYAQSIQAGVKVAFSFGPIPKSELYEDLIKNGRLKEPDTYKDLSKLKWFDSFGINYTKVPVRDIKVITSCFYKCIISQKYDVNGVKKHIWGKRLFELSKYIIVKHGIKSFYFLALSGKEFLEIILYSSMFPGIRKKYGLIK